MEEQLVYRSVLPAFVVEFQDGKFLDVDDIDSFTLSKTDDKIPQGIAILLIRIGTRKWHEIKNVVINGRPATVLAFDRSRMGDEEDSFFNYSDDDVAKLIVKYELTDEELYDHLSRQDLNFGEQDGQEDNESKDNSSVLQCGEDAS